MNQQCLLLHKLCKTESTRKYLQNYGAKTKAPPNQKLQENTHTRDGVFPPIMVRIDKIHLFGPQPQERIKLYFL